MSRTRRAIAGVPWLLAGVSLAFMARWVVLFAAFWATVLVCYRAVARDAGGDEATVAERTARVGLDLAVGGICALAIFEGGWFMLPAVGVFALLDAAGIPSGPPRLPSGVRGTEVLAALLAAFLGWDGLALGVSWPIYATGSSAIEPDGRIVTTYSAPSPLEAGLSPALATGLVLAAVLFGLVLGATAVHARTHSPAFGRLAQAVVATLVVAILPVTLALGAWAVPGIALALLAGNLAGSREESTRPT